MQIPQIHVKTKLTGHRPDSANQDHWSERLSDGTQVLIRPLGAKDRELERDFIKNLSPTSKHFRFFGEFKQPSEALLDQLLDVDNIQRMAFIAVIGDGSHLREIGVSRFAAEPDGKRCECAIAVADDWDQRGLSVTLMKHLIAFAREKGFVQMFSIDSEENLPMRDLAKELGFAHQPDLDDATMVRYELDL